MEARSNLPRAINPSERNLKVPGGGTCHAWRVYVDSGPTTSRSIVPGFQIFHELERNSTSENIDASIRLSGRPASRARILGM